MPETPTMGDPAIQVIGEIEPNTHTFVVKIWREETTSSADYVAWRGHITHVASGQRRYVTSLGELHLFIGLYLRELNVQLPLFWRIYQWFNR
ncbi:MAG: hypothetical protein SH847_19210 [Roseiflexaceae bacterium]|nr:hypothetical protein [Roseiflexaceae bacterium]